jgi:raffinose/stachyose/melibiose transport system substrate-binding protein
MKQIRPGSSPRRGRSALKRQSARGHLRWAAAALACSCAVVATSATSTATAATKTTLKFWTLEFQGGNQGMQKLIADFEAKYPNVSVQYTYLPDNSYKVKLLPALQTSAAPDVFEAFNGASFAGLYVKDHAVVPLNKYYSQYNWRSRWSASTIGTVFSQGSQVYGVPNVAAPLALFYSKTIFKKENLAIPTTLSQLESTMATLKTDGYIPLVIGGLYSWNTLYVTDNLIQNSCGPTTTLALQELKTSWTQSCVTQAFTTLGQWVKDGYFPPGFLGLNPNSGESNGIFFGGKGAMLFAGGWIPPTMAQEHLNESNFGVFAFPNSTGTLYFGGDQVMISSASKVPAVAAQFINFLTSPAEQGKYQGQLNSPYSLVNGVTISASNGPFGPVMRNMLTGAKGAFTTTDTTAPTAVYEEVYNAQDLVCEGKLTGAQAGTQIQAAVEKYLKTGQ